MRSWNLQANPAETKSVLAHSAPFLIFLGFPLVAASQNGIGTPQWFTVVTATLAYTTLYLLTAVALPIPPQAQNISPRFTCWQLTFALGTLGFMGLIYASGGVGTVFLLSYFLSLWILQAPKPLVVPGAFTIVAFSMAVAWLVPGEIKFSPAIVTLAGFTVFMSRKSIDLEYESKVNAAKELLYAQEKERNRISAELHDVLGQTLTALSLKAELGEKLIAAQQTEKAAQELKQLQGLTRQALGEIRAVVAANRALDIESEIQNCTALCETAGIKLQLQAEYAQLPTQLRTISAYVLREAITNAMRHATPTVIQVVINRSGIQVTNDITKLKTTLGTGLGLESLKQRVGNLGTLNVTQTENQWNLKVTFKQIKAQDKG